MTLKLILMRHAKSAWDDPLLDDANRTLNARGRAAAPLIARWLAEKGHLPDTALVSSAKRTVETWERMAPLMAGPIRMETHPALYLASSDVIHGVLAGQTAQNVMVICHNPGIADFAARALSHPPDQPKFRQYPTAATSVIAFDAPGWDQIGWGKGTLLDFVTPRDLDPAPSSG